MIEFIAGCIAGIAIAKKVRAISEWSPPAYIRIVKMGNDKYAVRKGYLVGYTWLDLNDGTWWARQYASKYCFGTLEQCEELMRGSHSGNGTPV